MGVGLLACLLASLSVNAGWVGLVNGVVCCPGICESNGLAGSCAYLID